MSIVIVIGERSDRRHEWQWRWGGRELPPNAIFTENMSSASYEERIF